MVSFLILPTAYATAIEMPDLNHTYTIPQLTENYTTAHSNTRSLTHWARPGIKPASSRILVRCFSAEPQQELPERYAEWIITRITLSYIYGSLIHTTYKTYKKKRSISYSSWKLSSVMVKIMGFKDKLPGWIFECLHFLWDLRQISSPLYTSVASSVR